jgi:hypothetical protein
MKFFDLLFKLKTLFRAGEDCGGTAVKLTVPISDCSSRSSHYKQAHKLRTTSRASSFMHGVSEGVFSFCSGTIIINNNLVITTPVSVYGEVNLGDIWKFVYSLEVLIGLENIGGGAGYTPSTATV